MLPNLTDRRRVHIVSTLVNKGARITTVFSALADPTRRSIVERLSRRGEVPVTKLAEPFEMSLPAFSRHLRVLEQARLVQRRREGRLHLIRPRRAGLKAAHRWIARYAAGWASGFDALDRRLEADKRQG